MFVLHSTPVRYAIPSLIFMIGDTPCSCYAQCLLVMHENIAFLPKDRQIVVNEMLSLISVTDDSGMFLPRIIGSPFQSITFNNRGCFLQQRTYSLTASFIHVGIKCK